MSVKIVTCDKCDSRNYKELNPEQRGIVKRNLCKIDCECLDCGHLFSFTSWTRHGKQKGILY